MTEALAAPALASFAALLAVAAVRTRRDDVVHLALSASTVERAPRAGIAVRVGSLTLLRRLARPDRLAALLSAAGSGRSVEHASGVKWLAAASGILVALALAGPVLAPVAGVVGYVLPDLGLSRAARRRRARADRELPLFLDLLAATATAGLTGQLAVRRAVEATTGPLSEELATALHRVDLGGRWKDELEAAAARLALGDLRRTVAVLTRSDAIGSSLTDALSEIARESRESRRTLVTERARKAPVKMLFPLVFLVLPAFLLLTVVPVLVTTLQSIR